MITYPSSEGEKTEECLQNLLETSFDPGRQRGFIKNAVKVQGKKR